MRTAKNDILQSANIFLKEFMILLIKLQRVRAGTCSCCSAIRNISNSAPNQPPQKKLPKGADAVENRIRELRRQQKVTQDELAKAVGVTRQTIISLEGGKYVASLGLAHKLAVFFGVTIEDIFIFD